MCFLVLFFILNYSALEVVAPAIRCLYFNSRCVDHCPRNMHPYHTRCDIDTMSQRTCVYREVYSLGYTCGWSRCDCNSGLFLTDDWICVEEKHCPVSRRLRKGRRHRKGQPKNKPIRFQDDDIMETNSKLHMMDEAMDEPPKVRYTGHCPLLKFRYGKCYGDNTRQILKEIRSKGLFNKPLEYRKGDNYELDNYPRRDMPKRDVYEGIYNRQPVYMTGYTGYVPGMSFRYGKSYGRAADDCMADFTEHQRDMRRKADYNKSNIRSRSAPKMETIHTRDEIRQDLNRFREINKYKSENSISPEFPPIAGYTGHIPRIKGSEASLSQRYHCAAKRGLELIRIEKEAREELQNANSNVKAILRDKEKRSSYWNWG